MSGSKIKTYQENVRETDQFKSDSKRSLQISFKNIRRELEYIQQSVFNELSSGKEISNIEWSKTGNESRIGDILWYLTNISNHLGFDLESTIDANIKKVSLLYQKENLGETQHDIPLEKLPIDFEIGFIALENFRVSLVTKLKNNEILQIGDTIDDNSHDEDSYRFHDVFHLSYVSYLNWSPVLRALFRRKRKSLPTVDRIQDGARAIIIEEAVSAAIFERAKKVEFFEGRQTVDYEILDLIKGMTTGLEVNKIHHLQWEKAILAGYKGFRDLVKNKGGIIKVKENHLEFLPISHDKDFESLQRKYYEKSLEETKVSIDSELESKEEKGKIEQQN